MMISAFGMMTVQIPLADSNSPVVIFSRSPASAVKLQLPTDLGWRSLFCADSIVLLLQLPCPGSFTERLRHMHFMVTIWTTWTAATASFKGKQLSSSDS
jgi:hypothetical protein